MTDSRSHRAEDLIKQLLVLQRQGTLQIHITFQSLRNIRRLHRYYQTINYLMTQGKMTL